MECRKDKLIVEISKHDNVYFLQIGTYEGNYVNVKHEHYATLQDAIIAVDGLMACHFEPLR